MTETDQTPTLEHTSLHQSIIDAGLIHLLEAEPEDPYRRTHERTSAIVGLKHPSGAVQVGLNYSCQGRYEEEEGSTKLREVFEMITDPDTAYGRVLDEDPTRVQYRKHIASYCRRMLTQAELTYVDDQVVAFCHDGLSEWGLRAIERAKAWLLSTMPAGSGLKHRHHFEWMTVPDLKAHLKERGVKTTGMKKADLVDAAMLEQVPEHPMVQSAWFDNGEQLVIPRGTGIWRIVTDRLIDAANAGALFIGHAGTSNPFAGAGLTIFDTRDLSEEDLAEIAAMRRRHRHDQAVLDSIKDVLTARGHRWYALSGPKTLDTGDGRQVKRYFINGRAYKAPGHQGHQPHGWYTAEELIAGKFVDDMIAERGIDPSLREQVVPSNW